VAKTTILGNFLTFLGAPVPHPFYRRGPDFVCYSRPTDYGRRLPAKFHLDRFILSSCGGEKPQFLPFFGIRHLVVSLVGSNLRKLNTGAQVQAFPYPMASKSFLYSNAFMAKSGAQPLMFKSVTNKQTDKQTKKLNVFGFPGGG